MFAVTRFRCTKFFSIYFTITRARNIVNYTEGLVVIDVRSTVITGLSLCFVCHAPSCVKLTQLFRLNCYFCSLASIAGFICFLIF